MKNIKKIALFLFVLALSSEYLAAQPMNYVEESKKVIYELKDQQFDKVYSRFDTVVSKILTKEKLEATWKSFIQQVGEFKSIEKDTSYQYQNFPLVVLTVKFEKMDFNFIFAFNSSNQLNTFRITPANQAATYKNPPYTMLQNFNDKAVYFGKDDWKLPGTLYTPRSEVKHPAIVLVHGSGPNDRDETIGPNKVFKDLSLGLATKGITVLTYDKRTKVYADKMVSMKNLTINEEVIEDALEAVKFLKSQPDVDAKRIFLLGHSLGAMLAPKIAQQCPDLAGIIMMAAPSGKLEDIVLEQIYYINNLDGKIDSSEKEQLDTLKAQIARVKSPELNDSMPQSLLPLGSPATYWIELNKYNQVETAKKIKIPMYILQGERDYQVNMAQYEVWKKELKNMPNVSFKSYVSLYHLFIPGVGKSTPSEYMTEGHVSSDVIDDIFNWIQTK